MTALTLFTGGSAEADRCPELWVSAEPLNPPVTLRFVGDEDEATNRVNVSDQNLSHRREETKQDYK